MQARLSVSTPSDGYVLIDGSQVHSTSATWADCGRPDHDVIRQLRAFAWRFGPELEPARSSFGRLAQLHRISQDLSEPVDWQSLLEMVAVSYPRRSSAQALKSWALNESASSLANPLTSLDRLSVLSRLTGASAFPEWGHSLASTFSKALSASEAEFGVFLSEFSAFATAPACEALLRLSAEHLDGDTFVALIRSSPDAVALRAFDLRPSILGDPSLWQSEGARHRALAWLPTTKIGELLIVAAVRAVVVASQPVGLADLAECAGQRAIDAAFDVLGEGAEWDGSLQMGSDWISTLRAHPEQGVSWLARSERPSAALARLVLERLRPGDRQIRVLGNSHWGGIAKSIDPSTAEGSSVHAFALGVGFHDTRLSASSLVAEVFQTVHDSAEEGRLDDEDWDKLERVFPGPRRVLRRQTRSGVLGRGRVLRRAVVEAFGRRDWPVAAFLEAVSDTAVLSLIVAENVRTRSGKALGRRLNAAIQGDDLVLSDLQRKALDPWIDS